MHHTLALEAQAPEGHRKCHGIMVVFSPANWVGLPGARGGEAPMPPGTGCTPACKEISGDNPRNICACAL